MKVNMILTRNIDGDVVTHVYLNDKPILSDTHVTPYQLLQALSQYIPRFDVEPLAFTEDVSCILEEQYV